MLWLLILTLLTGGSLSDAPLLPQTYMNGMSGSKHALSSSAD